VQCPSLNRFGKWHELLAMDAPPEHLRYTTAMWRMNRAVALAAKGRIADAERETFFDACAKVPVGQLAQINPAERVLAIGRHFLDGEIAYAKRDYPAAERELRAAAAIEDTLLYMEPPDWMQPVRHTLGTVLMDAGRFADAERAYREDLARWKENGWSLLGLAEALERQGKTKEAAEIRQRQANAWASADISAHATCLCAPKR
jgi:tetratricopeptide (TPR) repeat protein